MSASWNWPTFRGSCPGAGPSWAPPTATTLSATPPRCPGRKQEYRDVSALALKTIEYNEIDVLLAVGGDGTQSIAQLFFEKYRLPVIGIPKTIDNDLNGTDVTFGFDTALNTATTAIDKLHSTAEAHHRVMVIEVMGRYAGWIALEAGLAGGGDVILIPEIPFQMDKVCEKISERFQKGKRFSSGRGRRRGQGRGRANWSSPAGERRQRPGPPGRHRRPGGQPASRT